MSESCVEKATTQAAFNVGVPSTKFGVRGWPDRIFWIPGGKPLLIEFKSPRQKPRPLQEHRIDQLRQLGYAAEVHDDDKKAFASILRHLEATQVPGVGDEVLAGPRRGWAVPKAWIG